MSPVMFMLNKGVVEPRNVGVRLYDREGNEYKIADLLKQYLAYHANALAEHANNVCSREPINEHDKFLIQSTATTYRYALNILGVPLEEAKLLTEKFESDDI